jgi:SAM-dependent methyltransferase
MAAKNTNEKIPVNHQISSTWAQYWKHYHGVTAIGAWSQRLSLAEALQLLSREHIPKTSMVIDIGCGEGRTLLAFQALGYKKSVGIDNSKEALRICQKNGLRMNTDIFLADAEHIKYKDKLFDVVFSEGLVEHFTDPMPVIHEIARLSRRYILLIQPNHYSLYGRFIAVVGHMLRNNVREYPYPLSFFKSTFRQLNFRLKAKSYTPLREFFILLFERE